MQELFELWCITESQNDSSHFMLRISEIMMSMELN